MTWEEVDWRLLKRLRAKFLGDATEAGDYWKSQHTLENYDWTFAQRIGWKWEAVLGELQRRGWSPPEGQILDWGCGSGIASRKVAAAWPREAQQVAVWDQSPLARRFAADSLRAEYAGARVTTEIPSARIALLIISHVFNELRDPAILKPLLTRAETVIWVEPGTFAISRGLIAIREQMREETTMIAPCTHSAMCGMLQRGNERHWCHHFAEVPPNVFLESGWGNFSRILEIDLRALPYSFLVMDRRPNQQRQIGCSRIIGEPRQYKGFSRVLSCQAEGVEDLVLQKRDDPVLVKELRKDPGSVYSWERNGERITSGSRVA